MKDIQVIGKIINKCFTKRSRIHGIGTFAVKRVDARRKIGSLSGYIIPKSRIPKVFSKNASIALVELENGRALDSRTFKNELCFINHSCRPNCYMRIIGNVVEIYSLTRIKAGQELTLDYSETHHEGKLSCNCQAANCKNWL